jgi:hypothetical protein
MAAGASNVGVRHAEFAPPTVLSRPPAQVGRGGCIVGVTHLCAGRAIMHRYAGRCFRCRCHLARGDEASAEARLPVDVHACAIGSLRLESIGWIVCQPKTLTVLVPRNPLLEPPTFRAEPEARRLGRGRGGSQDVGLAPVRARKDGHGG